MAEVKINPYIFRGYDLRGVMGTDLNEDTYYVLGRAYATMLAKRRIKEAAVGHDNRLNGEIYSQSFIKGLNDSGINTFDIGPSLSQIVYYSSYYFHTKGGAMISASHNPKEYNGLKLSIGYSDTFIGEEMKEYLQTVQSNQFVSGKGVNQKIDIFSSYKKDILKHFSLQKKWKVVIDGCNTYSGIFYPQMFREAGCEVVEQNCNPDSSFPLGDPDPTEHSVLQRLSQSVIAAQADIGFAYDADGDRLAVVDDKGQVLWMDTIVSLFAKDVLDFLPGSPIVYNTLCSRQVTETIEKSGGKPVIWLTGHSFIKAKIKQERAPFGGELSGHIFFMDNFYGHDDAIYASLRLLSYLERKEQTLSQTVSQLPQYISSPEIKLGLADEIKFDFIKNTITPELIKIAPDAQYTDIDGFRFDTDSTMAIVRASQNGPYLTVKFEGKTQDQYQKLKQDISRILHSYKEIDWSSGVNIQALD